MRAALRIGTRSSALALAQAERVRARIADLHPDRALEIVAITTSGDRAVAPIEAGGKGAFTTEIQRALSDGTVDLAVHSAKDLPSQRPDGIWLSITERVDARDVMITRDRIELDQLEPGARIGTSSLRRAAQLRALGHGYEPTPIRGNVDTRVRLVTEGRYDAIVVAMAGIKRLGIEHLAVHIFDPDLMTPAPGQGALAVECRTSDDQARAVLEMLGDVEAARAYEAENAFVAALGGDCALPLGAFATIDGPNVRLRGMVATPDGARVLRDEAADADAVRVAAELSARMLGNGAAAILAMSGGAP